MEKKLKKKLNEWKGMIDLIVNEGMGINNEPLIAAVLVLAAEVEDVKDEVRKLGDIVSTK